MTSKRRKTRTPKRRKPQAGSRGGGSSDAWKAKAEPLARELREAREQQAAASQVLGIIASSRDDLQPVFAAILANAVRLCDARFASLLLRDGPVLRRTATHGGTRAYTKEFRRNPTIAHSRHSAFGRMIRTKRPVQDRDIRKGRAYRERDPVAVTMVERAGARTLASVPMMKGDELIGAIIIYRREVRAFTDKQIELVQSFAAQAVIAIENARLLGELRESLRQQTATSDVLKVISSSPGDLKPVFDAMLENATRICEAKFGNLMLLEGDAFRTVALSGAPPALAGERARDPMVRPGPNVPLARAVITKQAQHIADLRTEQAYQERDPAIVSIIERGGARTILVVPMLKDNRAIGAIVIYRQEVRPFADKQIELVSNFAAQAVIAIENTRLLSELRQRTDDLTESLEQQTATSEVLKVISSSPGELEPVFQAMIANATRICEANFGMLHRFHDGALDPVALGSTVPTAYANFVRKRGRFVPEAGNTHDRVIKTKKLVHTVDETKSRTPTASAKLGGARTQVIVPMLKDGALMGTITIYRQEVRPFTDKQIELLQNFAAQAVIAIENTRLLSELRQRTNDLSESLEQQTATSEVLKVISSSPGELEPVFDAMLTNAMRICEAPFGNLFLYDGRGFTPAVLRNVPPEYAEIYRDGAYQPGPNTGLGRVVSTKKVVHVADIAADQAAEGDPLRTAAAKWLKTRTFVAVPMLKDENLVGAIVMYRQEVRPFTDKQIELVQNFAAQAVIAIENTRLLSELRQRTDDLTESLEQQTATADVLSIISRSPGELKPVFHTILENATRICSSKFGTLVLRNGDTFRSAAMSVGAPAAFAAYRQRDPVIRSTANSALARLARTKEVFHIEDAAADPDYAIHRDPGRVAIVEMAGARTMLFVPMLREDELIGAIIIYRQEVRRFSDKQVELLKNFAAQAVIAIENARLLNELHQRTDDLTESLEQQTATSEVLKVISSSPGELEPIFDAIMENAIRICGAKFGTMGLLEGDAFRAVALINAPPAYAEERQRHPLVRPRPISGLGRVMATKKAVQIADLRTDKSYLAGAPGAAVLVDAAGARTLLAVPMLKDDELVGVIAIYRQEVLPFTDKQIELVSNFAAQAVIAIENTRLLNELRQRTDDLGESLEQQTATSEVLQAISSSPGELQPVFDAILANATRLCDAKFANLLLHRDGAFDRVALYGAEPSWAEARQSAFRPGPFNPVGRMIRDKQVVHVLDMAAEQAYLERDPTVVPVVEKAGARTIVGVPMLKDNELLGAIAVYRQEVRPFTDKQIELVQNFAAQAVIAIENARLLNELRQRTDDLSESLEQQTATSEVLKVISSSPGDLQPVFDAMLANATKLCEASYGVLWLWDGSNVRAVALHGALPEAYLERLRGGAAFRAHPDRPGTRAMTERRPIQVADLREEPAYLAGDPLAVTAADDAGIRTLVAVPMYKDDQTVGNITIYRREVRPFSDKQVDLLANFAAQAVIAIENTRLLSELRQRTDDLTESLEQQTATSEVLKVISSSPGELEPVFQAMLENATRICGAKFGNLMLFEADKFHRVAMYNPPPEYLEFSQKSPLLDRFKVPSLNRLTESRQAVQVADMVIAEPESPMARLGRARTMLTVPMLKENKLVGAIGIYRQEVRPFTDKQIALVQNFAAQAVIAIENTRLLSELRQRTDDLSESLEQQTATSEVLKVISSTSGELQPVFNTVLAKATELCGASYGALWLSERDKFQIAAFHGDLPGTYVEVGNASPLAPDSPAVRAAKLRQPVQVADMKMSKGYLDRDPLHVIGVDVAGIRTLLAVPMFKEGEAVGAIVIYRKEVRPFTDKQIELVQNFAAQAVIAIENARLLNELRQRTDDLTESLEQQTATSEVLKVISSSPGDLDPVVKAILSNAVHVCAASFGIFRMREGDQGRSVASHDVPAPLAEELQREPATRWDPNVAVGLALTSKRVVHVHDMKLDAAYLEGNRRAISLVELGGARTVLFAPLLKDNKSIGVLTLYRQEVRPFADKQIELVQNFAAQAVIAIENTRLLNELRQRTDDLSESLEQQTATSEVLKVISSSPGELEPVFQAMLANASRICGAKIGAMYLRDGDAFRAVGTYGTPPAFAEERQRDPLIHPTPKTALGRLTATKQIVHIPDITAEEAYAEGYRPWVTMVELGGCRTLLTVPLLKDGDVVGAIAIYRQEVRPFTDKQIELVSNFAAQAVIAIENTRLLSELRQRTDDLTESLEQQTATSEVLKVISSSPGDLAPVFQAMLENAVRICEATFGVLNLHEDGVFRMGASHNVPAAFAEFLHKHGTFKPLPGSMLDRVMRMKQVFHTADNATEAIGRAATLGGARSSVVVPMLKDNDLIGTLTIYRQEVRPFAAKQIELLENFAAQAVIAIENTRLLSELRQRTDDLSESLEQQTATSEVLKVISSSPDDVQPVFETILERATHICRARFGVLHLREGDAFRTVALHNPPIGYAAAKMRDPMIRDLPKESTLAQVAATKQPVQITDVQDDDSYRGTAVASQASFARASGARSLLAVPMLKGGELIGAIVIFHRTVERFGSPGAACRELRRPGGDRHRERAAAQRAARAHR